MPSLVTAPDEKPDPQVKPAESSETKSAIESDEPKQRETKPRTKPQDARTAASAPAVAPSSGKARAAQVTASQGEMIAYAAAIRARLASKKPTSIRRKGTVTITFGLSAAGSLLFARIADGSGHADLDAAVIASVHRAAPFPEAPDRKDRTFTLPFHFR
jgi:protein TonB